MVVYVGAVGLPRHHGYSDFSHPSEGALAGWLNGVDAAGVEIIIEGRWWERGDTVAVTHQLLAGFAGRVSIHGPFLDLNLGSNRTEVRKVSLESHLRAIEWAVALRADHFVVHPFNQATLDISGTRTSLASAAIRQLDELTTGSPVQLLVENLADPTPGSLNRFLELLDDIPLSVGVLLDVGHVHLSGWDLAEVVGLAGQRVEAIHVHDNHGHSDDHLPIGAGAMDWAYVFPTLRSVPTATRWVTEFVDLPDSQLRRQLRLLEAEQRRPGLSTAYGAQTRPDDSPHS